MDWQQLEPVSHLERDLIWAKATQTYESNTPNHDFRIGSLASLPPHVYQPLKSLRGIRLLLLQGSTSIHGQEFPVLRGRLVEVSLESDPFYLALSYVWGDPTQKFPIVLDGQLLSVTANLHSALQRLQQDGTVVPLWVDAICINQADDLEKSSQVQEMGAIYRTAQLVLGWLGSHSDSSDLAMSTLHFLGIQALSMPDGPNTQERRELFLDILPPSSDATTSFPTPAVVALLNRPYWRRVWILQEVVLAKNVYLLCGDSDVEFFPFMLGFTMLYELPMLDIAAQGALTTRIAPLLPILKCDPRLMNVAIRGHNQDPIPLRNRLEEAQLMGATDPKDHILGLLGMVSDAAEIGIKADYSKSCSELFTQVVVGLAVHQGNLQILSRCSLRKTREDLPSWVPDFSQRSTGPIWRSQYSLYRAGGRSWKKIEMEGENLKIAGSKFDVVKKIGPSWDENDFDFHEPELAPGLLSSTLQAIEDFAHSNCTPNRSASEIEDSVWRTAILDTGPIEFTPTGRRNVRAKDSVRWGFESVKDPEGLMIASEEERRLRNVYSSAYKLMMAYTFAARTLFVTEKGYLGIGPKEVKAGDHVCVFWGAEVPFILRPRRGFKTSQKQWFWERDQGHFDLVGESFVHGIMSGEWKYRVVQGEDFILH